MSELQREVLLALNLRQMQMADHAELGSSGVFTAEVAAAAGLSNRSTANVLAGLRRRGWVASCHWSDLMGWLLIDAGVAALEADRAAAA